MLQPLGKSGELQLEQGSTCNVVKTRYHSRSESLHIAIKEVTPLLQSSSHSFCSYITIHNL